MGNSPVKLKDVDSEQKIVSCLLKDTHKIDRVMLEVTPEHFTDKKYKNLYVIITQVYAKHASLITNELLSNYLESKGFPAELRLGYLKEIDELTKLNLNDAEFSFALTSVKKAYVASSVSDMLVNATRTLENKGGYEAFKVLDKQLYDLKLLSSNNSNIDNSMEAMDDRNVDKFYEHLMDIKEHPDKYKGMPTGWLALDQMTGGFLPGEYALIVARTNGGKSLGLLNWANHAQKNGYNIVFVTVEMTRDEVHFRKLSLESGIPFVNLKSQQLTVEQTEIQRKVLYEDINKRDKIFYIPDVPNATVGFIEAQLRQIRKNVPIDAVFIDYLGKLKTETNVKDKMGWEVFAAISNDLADLARSMNIVVVSAQQVNATGGIKTTKDDIVVEDIALSKPIAYPAHTIVGLILNQQNPHEMTMCVPKCRGGRLDRVKLWCDLNVCKIVDMSQAPLQSDGDLNIPDDIVEGPEL